MRAQYYGMIGDVDAQVGRVLDALGQLGQWEDTFVLLTSDHGEQLGDHGLINKLGYFEESYQVPAIVRAPTLAGAHGSVVEAFTENIDFFPTICEALGIEIPAQCDGLPLTGFLEGRLPPMVARRGDMGVRLAIPRPSRRRLRLAVGPAPGT